MTARTRPPRPFRPRPAGPRARTGGAVLAAGALLAGAACANAPVPEEGTAGPPDRAGVPAEVVDLTPLFEDADEATFVLLDLESGRVVRHDPARAAERFLPASTFKVANTLIALEAGVVDGPSFAMAWDSVAVPRGRFFPDTWARDQTLETAFRNSVYWVYQALAREIGPDRYAEWLARFDYGNRDTGGGIDRFWLEGGLRISADEQTAFLRRLWNGDLGVSDRSRTILLDLMRLESPPGVRLLGKTGTAGITATRELGWIVGFVEIGERAYAYALNMEGERVWESWPPQRRRELVIEILDRPGVVEPASPMAGGGP